MVLKTMRREKHITLLLVRSKLGSIEKIISKALRDSDISHEEFIPMINEEQNYFRLKERIIAKDDQLSDIEQGRLIGYGKRIGQNERQSLKLKTDV